MSEPRKSPPLLALERVWDDYCASIATEQDVLLVLEASAELAQLQIDSLVAQISAGQSDLKNQIVKKILQGFNKHLEAVDIMSLEFEEPEVGHFERGLDLAQVATDQLADGYAELMGQIEAMGQINCIFCSTSNPRGSERCQRCGRQLPVAEEDKRELFSAVNAEGLEGGAPAITETENSTRLALAVQNLKEGQIQAEAMQAELDEVERRLAGHREDNAKFGSSLESSKDPRAAAGLAAVKSTQVAIDKSLVALDTMRAGFEQENDALLEAGLAEYRAASALMLEAMRAMEAARA